MSCGVSLAFLGMQRRGLRELIYRHISVWVVQGMRERDWENSGLIRIYMGSIWTRYSVSLQCYCFDMAMNLQDSGVVRVKWTQLAVGPEASLHTKTSHIASAAPIRSRSLAFNADRDMCNLLPLASYQDADSLYSLRYRPSTCVVADKRSETEVPFWNCRFGCPIIIAITPR